MTLRMQDAFDFSEVIMTRIFVVAFCIGFFFGQLLHSNAAETRGTSAVRARISAPSGNRYFVGLSGATGSVNLGDRSSPDLKSSGDFSQAVLMGSLETRRFVFELGFGTFSSRITGSSSAAPGMNSLTLNSYSMNRAGELGHLGARYRFTDSVEAGAFTQILFGPDVGFNPTYLKSGMTSAFLAGADALYGFSFIGLRWKAGGRVFQSIGLEDRTLTAFQGVVQTSLAI